MLKLSLLRLFQNIDALVVPSKEPRLSCLGFFGKRPRWFARLCVLFCRRAECRAALCLKAPGKSQFSGGWPPAGVTRALAARQGPGRGSCRSAPKAQSPGNTGPRPTGFVLGAAGAGPLSEQLSKAFLTPVLPDASPETGPARLGQVAGRCLSLVFPCSSGVMFKVRQENRVFPLLQQTRRQQSSLLVTPGHPVRGGARGEGSRAGSFLTLYQGSHRTSGGIDGPRGGTRRHPHALTHMCE